MFIGKITATPCYMINFFLFVLHNLNLYVVIVEYLIKYFLWVFVLIIWSWIAIMFPIQDHIPSVFLWILLLYNYKCDALINMFRYLHCVVFWSMYQRIVSVFYIKHLFYKMLNIWSINVSQKLTYLCACSALWSGLISALLII